MGECFDRNFFWVCIEFEADGVEGCISCGREMGEEGEGPGHGGFGIFEG